MDNIEKKREPLFHIVKKTNVTKKQALKIRALAILIGFLIIGIIAIPIYKADPFSVFIQLFVGCFSSPRRIWKFLLDLMLLVGVGLALIPAFKMKFWNLGGNGQILISCLVAIMCMFFLGGKIPDPVIVLIMIPSSILAGAIWAVIPAIFKAIFKTNESLFTLMMNYVAEGLVAVFLTEAVKSGSGTLGIVKTGNLPVLGHPYFLPILVVALLVGFIFVYLRYSKHGYELSVVGGSENTAKYVGINVRKVIIRTMLLSGAICGIIGLLIAGSIDHTVSTTSASNMGFTAIMVAWLAKFNPIAMLLSSFLITFLSRGMRQVNTEFGVTSNAIGEVMIGVMYFFIIGCEFFINYKIIFRHNAKDDNALVEKEEN